MDEGPQGNFVDKWLVETPLNIYIWSINTAVLVAGVGVDACIGAAAAAAGKVWVYSCSIFGNLRLEDRRASNTISRLITSPRFSALPSGEDVLTQPSIASSTCR